MVGEQFFEMVGCKPKPHVAHLLVIAVTIVRQHVGDDDAAVRLEHARDFGKRERRLRQMMKHEHQRGGVEAFVVDRKRFEVTASEADVVHALEAFAGGLQHGGRGIDRDDLGDKRGEHRAQLARAAAKIAHCPRRVRKRSERGDVKAIAEELVPQAIPLSRL